LEDQHKEDLDRVLEELRADESLAAAEQFLPLVYDDLRAVASGYLRRERVDHTLQATALVHEAYARLAGGNESRWQNKAHFFRVAAKVMRRILVNHARDVRADKRGGDRRRVQLEETGVLLACPELDILDLDDLMSALATVDATKARVVELRFFAGCTVEETAAAMELSVSSVERHWRFSRAWLSARLSEDHSTQRAATTDQLEAES